MSTEFLLLSQKNTDRLIEQTKTKSQETEFKLNQHLDTSSFNPPGNFSEQGKWLLAVTHSEATNSVFKITDENGSFSINTLGCGTPNDGEGTIDRLN